MAARQPVAEPPPAAAEADSEAWRITWNELLDGRLHRFKRGLHYSGPAEALEEEARNAATELGKTAITFRDDMQVFEYVWVQFLDGKLEEGQPCPKCGHTSFEKVQEYFLRCRSCGSLYALTQPKPVIPEPERPPIAEYLGLRLLSAEGDEIDEVSALEEMVLEATCCFFRPVRAVQPAFIFLAGGKNILHAACPDVVAIPEPETVRFTLHVAPGVLSPGHYFVAPQSKLVLDEDPDDIQKLAPSGTDRTSSQFIRKLHVFDPRAEVPPEHRGGTTLQWGAETAAGGTPMPVIDEWVADDDEGEG